jgi:hypothetical protein
MAIELKEQPACRIEPRQDGLFQIRCGEGDGAPLFLDRDGGGLSKEKADELLNELAEFLAVNESD